jgi:hypothetical protein
MAENKFLDKDRLLYLVNKLEASLVKKETGKGLSTNDFTTAEKNKLSTLKNTEIVNNLNSTDTDKALSAAMGKEIVDSLSNFGAGDMMKATYDSNSNGIVDNAEKLGGNLPSYYASNTELTNNYYNKTNVDNLISALKTIEIKAVDTLPSTGASNVIYLVPNPAGIDRNSKIEYVWLDTDKKFEQIGTTDVDLSGYLQKTDIELISNADIDSIFTSVFGG